MVGYRLTVVGSSDGQYLINFYHKISEVKLPNLQEVLGLLKQVKPTFLKPEPVYLYLHEDEREIIERFRRVRIGGLEKKSEQNSLP